MNEKQVAKPDQQDAALDTATKALLDFLQFVQLQVADGCFGRSAPAVAEAERHARNCLLALRPFMKRR